MTERPSPERLAEIRAWLRRQDGAQAPLPWRSDVTDLLAEIDTLRAERDALRTIARDVAIAEASIASCVIHGAPREVFREHRAEWQRALAALRGWLAG